MISLKHSLKKISVITATAPIIAMVGCDFGSSSKDTAQENPVIPTTPTATDAITVSTLEDLPNCTSKRESNLAYVSDNEAFYTCTDERWTKVNVVSTEDPLPQITSSESQALSSDGNTPLVSSSSLNDTIVVINDPALPIPGNCFETWNGNDHVYQLNTGLDNGTETSGYWYSYSDDADGGTSTIEWYVPMGDYPWMIDPIIDACGGVCGTYRLSKGILDYEPFAAVGFNVAGIDADGNASTADASSWGGITVTYTSEMALTMELGLGESLDREVDYDLPSVTLPKAISAVTKTFAWSSFKQAGWGRMSISGEEAARSLAGIHFRFQGKDGMEGKFNIMAVGPLDKKCSYVSPVTPIVLQSSSSIELPKSSSSVRSSSSVTPKSSSSTITVDNSKSIKCGTFETWYGADGFERVNTGCDAGYDNSGYWSIYDDSMDGGKSTIGIGRPVSPGIEWSDNSLQPVIEYCGGLCGTYYLDKGILEYDPFVAIELSFAGTDKDGKQALADVTNMEGICISYSSYAAATLELSLGEEMDKKIGYALPSVDLAKDPVERTKEFKWSQFKQPSWGKVSVTMEDAAKAVASIRFKIQGKHGSTGSFNIYSIGPYKNGSCWSGRYAGN